MSYYCVVGSNNQIVGPVEINHAGFNALTDEQRKAGGFLPAELYNAEPQEGKTKLGPIIYRKGDQCRLYYRHEATPSQEAIDIYTALNAASEAFNTAFNGALESLEPLVALESMAEDINEVAEAWFDILNPPLEPEE